MGVLVVIGALAAVVWMLLRSTTSSTPSVEAAITHQAGKPADDRDTWEGGMWEAADPHKLSAKLRIDYVDGAGRKTTRNVQVREFDNTVYGGMFLAMCELRGEHRTFRFDRVKSCIDLDTGEVVTDVRRYMNAKYDASPERSTDLLLTDYLDALKVLYFVAKADGQFRAAEKEVVARYVRTLVRDERITVGMIDNALTFVEVPSLQAFKLAVGRVVKGGQIEPSALAACCREIVATQKTVHPAEKEALDYIERRAGETPKAGTPPP